MQSEAPFAQVCALYKVAFHLLLLILFSGQSLLPQVGGNRVLQRAIEVMPTPSGRLVGLGKNPGFLPACGAWTACSSLQMCSPASPCVPQSLLCASAALRCRLLEWSSLREGLLVCFRSHGFRKVFIHVNIAPAWMFIYVPIGFCEFLYSFKYSHFVIFCGVFFF